MRLPAPRSLKGRYLAACYITFLLGLWAPASCRIDGVTPLHGLYMMLTYPAYLPVWLVGERMGESPQEAELILRALGVMFALTAPFIVLGMLRLVRAVFRLLK